jgi:hypothetical protein
VAVIAFLFTGKQWRQTRHLQLLFVYFLLTFLNLSVATWLAFVNKPNIIWYNINGFTSLALLSSFFYHLLHSKKLKALVVCLTVTGLLSYLILLFVWDDNITFFSAGYSIYSLLIVIYCFLFLKEVFTIHHSLSLQTGSIVWIVSGLLTYFMGSYLIQVTFKLTTFQFLKTTRPGFLTPSLLWAIHNVIYCLACAFIAFHLLKGPRTLSREVA